MKASTSGPKKLVGSLKLAVQAGKANPAPPIGPALGQKGLNIMEFCKQFNALTAAMEGPVPVVITYYSDKTFTLEIKTAPASYLIKKAAGITAGSKEAGRTNVATIKSSKLREIAKIKIQDMSASTIENAIKTLAGTAISIGIEVEDDEGLFN
jgi:large subunit ribosomal protein L11